MEKMKRRVYSNVWSCLLQRVLLVAKVFCPIYTQFALISEYMFLHAVSRWRVSVGKQLLHFGGCGSRSWHDDWASIWQSGWLRWCDVEGEEEWYWKWLCQLFVVREGPAGPHWKLRFGYLGRSSRERRNLSGKSKALKVVETGPQVCGGTGSGGGGVCLCRANSDKTEDMLD